jgi:hypothetical protein
MTHPYKQLEGTQIWEVIYKGIDDLVENYDLEVKTARENIVGYLCKLLNESNTNGQ